MHLAMQPTPCTAGQVHLLVTIYKPRTYATTVHCQFHHLATTKLISCTRSVCSNTAYLNMLKANIGQQTVMHTLRRYFLQL